MKKVILSLLMLCTVVSAWSYTQTEVTISVSIDDENTSTDEVSGITVTGNRQVVTETVMNGATGEFETQNNPYWMVEGNNNIVIAAPVGYVIDGVTLTGGGNISSIDQSDHFLRSGYSGNQAMWVQEEGKFDYYSDLTFSTSGSSLVKVSSVTISYHEHKMTQYDSVTSTCIAAGMKEYWVCSDCGRTYSDEYYKIEVTNTESLELSIDPHNHNGNLEEVDEVLATCVSTGTMHHWHCNSCNHNYEDESGENQIENDNVTIAIDPGKHASTLEEVDEVLATCVSTGTMHHWHCTSCNHNYSDESGKNHIENDNVTTDIAPTNHVEKMQYFPEVAATCVANGTGAYYYCSHCEKYYINETDADAVSFGSLGTDIDPNNHNGQLKEVAYKNASCTEDGVYHHWHCDACGNDYADANATVEMNGNTVKPKYDADALLVSNSTIDDSYLLGDGADVTFNTDGDIATLTIGSESHQYEISASDPLTIEFSHTFKLTAIQDPNNTANYYATFYTSEGAYKLPEGVTAYTGVAGKSGENNVVVLTEIDNIIHKSEAVIVRSNSANITLMPSSNKNAAATGNVLTGTDEAKNLVTGDYALSSGSDGIGFYKWNNKSVAANNAYLNFGADKGDIFYLAHVVSYVTNVEGKTVPNDTIIIDNKIASEPSVTNEGYRIDGWFTESTFENEWDFDNDVVTRDTTLYAKWQQQFTVTFVTNGATETIASQTIDINQKVEEPTVSKTGCTFLGWYTESTFTNEWDFANDLVTENITLYAKWNQYLWYIGKTNPEDAWAILDDEGTLTIYGEGAIQDYGYTSSPFYRNETITEVVFDNASSITSIGNSLFQKCNALETITIPNSVATIGESAFFECANLSNVTLPENKEFTQIAFNTFCKCLKLSNVSIPNSVTIIGESAFENCGLTTLAIPDSVTTIGKAAFLGCANLSNITLPENELFTKLEWGTFSGCVTLSNITIPNTVTIIDEYAFFNCAKLNNITITSSVTTIGLYAFAGCTSFTELTIPSSVTNIGDLVIIGCGENFKTLAFEGTPTTIGSKAFSFISETPTTPTLLLPNNWGGEAYVDNETEWYGGLFNLAHVVSYNTNSTETVSNDTIVHNTKLTAPTVSKTGYKFLGWFTEDSFTNEWDFANNVVTKDTTLYAKWIQQFTVAFVTNGAAETIETQTIDNNQKVTEPSVSKTGYKFLGWFTEDTFTNEWDFANDVVTKDITLYAQWIQQFTVAFETNGAAETIESQTIDINGKVEKPTVSRDGYKFLGWFTESTFENEWDFDNDVVTRDTTLYAQWIQQFTVTFVTNGAAETIASQTIDNNQKVSEPSVSKAGYKFLGWYTEDTFTNEWDFANDKVTKDITLYAQWLQQFTVEFVTNGAAETIESQTIDINEKVEEPTVSRTGYKFLGWFTEDTFENQWDFANDVVTKDITLYAQWLQQFTVAFVTNGAAETIESQTIDNNQKVTEPTVTKTGCELRGWYTESTFENKWNFASNVVTANTTLYALWHQHVGVAQSLAATCENDGYAEHFVCECGKAFTTADCTTEITDLAAWKLGEGNLPAIGHNYVKGDWVWANDYSAALLEFVCQNDNSHIIPADATITSQTTKQTCSADGKITYFATALYDGEEYKTTADSIIPAAHIYVVKKWAWAEDFKSCIAKFVCQRDIQHTANVEAVVTTSTNENSQPVYIATATIDGVEYTDTVIGNIYYVGKTNLQDAWAMVSEDGTLTFYGEGEMMDFDEVNPPYYAMRNSIKQVVFDENANITSIGEYAFEMCENLTSITIPNTVETIGAGAFSGCERIESIAIPNSVEKIGSAAFAGCYELKTITLPEQLTAIEPATFLVCYSLSNVTIPDGVTTIGKSAFSSCGELKNIIIPNSVTAIEDSAFYTCEMLESIIIPNSVTTIGESAFAGCYELKTITLSEKLTAIAPSTFEWCESLTDVTIPDGVTTIGEAAFAVCRNLTSITIPNSLTTIENEVFVACEKLADITIPSSVTTIGSGILEYCFCGSVTFEGTPTNIAEDAFKEISIKPVLTLPEGGWTGEPYVDDKTLWYGGYFINEIENKIFIGKENPEDAWAEIDENGTLTIFGTGETQDYNYEGSENSPFLGRSDIKNIVFDANSNITALGSGTFMYSPNLTNATIPNTVTSIGASAFAKSNIATITLPDNLTEIASLTFEECKNLTDVTIPSKVETIGYRAFYGCKSFEDITIPNSVTSIAEDAFLDCKNLKQITLSENITTIESGTFMKCYSLESITIPSKVTSIGEEAFAYCFNLKSIILPNGLTTISRIAFHQCISLESLTIPATVTSVGEKIFGAYYKYDKGNFESLRFLGTPDNIDDNAFNDVNGEMGQSSPIDLYLPFDWSGEKWVDNKTPWYGGYFNLVKEDPTFYIGKDNPEDAWAVWKEDGTFTIYGTGATIDYYDEGWNWTEPAYSVIADRIKNVVFDESSNITSIGSGMFESFENLESIAIPNTVTYVGTAAFRGCNNLESITIPSSVITIGELILEGCYNLQSVTFEATPENINMYAFEYINDSDHPIDLYLPDNWDGIPYIDSKTQWYGGYFNSTPASICKFYIGKDNPKDAWAVFNKEDGTFTIYGTGATKECVEWGENWSSWTDPSFGCIYDRIKNIVFDESSNITSIGSGLFEYLVNLETITIPNTVNSIGREAFAGCGKLNDITIPESVLSIGQNILSGSALRSVTFEGTPTTIDKDAFAGMNTTPHLSLPDGWGGELYVNKDTKWYGGYFDNELEKIFYIGKYTPEDAWAKLSNDGTLTIYGNGETRDWEENSPFSNQFITTVVFDDDAEISTIGNRMFFNCKKITNITLPNSVTKIGSSAFGGCNNLADITIPNGVWSIGGNAFYSCQSIKSIAIPNSVSSIGAYAFERCHALEEVTLSSNMTTIEEGLFWNCSNLKKVIIPYGITTISTYAFESCSFTDITLPSSLKKIDRVAFWDCYYLKSITIPKNVSYIGEIFLNYCDNVQSVTFKGTPNYIDGSAFGRYDDPSHPIDLYLPSDWSGEKWINNQTPWYGGYFNMKVTPVPTKFYIGKDNPEDAWAVFNDEDGSFTIYGEGATQDYYDDDWTWTEPTYYVIADKIKNVVFDEASNITSIGSGMFSHCEYLESITIPNTVTTIGVSAFEYCDTLTNITLPEGLTEISDYAFADCYALTNITLPEGLTEISDYAFAGCYALTNITLSEGLTEISDGAFYGCESLESISFPSSVKTIGTWIVEDCYGLQSVTFEATPEHIDMDAFKGFNDSDQPIDLYLPDNWDGIPYIDSETEWYGGYFNSTPASICKFYIGKDNPKDAWAILDEDGTFTIYGTGATQDYYDEDWNWTEPTYYDITDRIKNVVFDESSHITSIGSGTFKYFENIKSIIIPNSVTSIGIEAFYYCYTLTNITLPEGLTEIAPYTFDFCESLESITIPSSITTIGSYILANSNTTKVTFEGTPTTISSDAFEDMNSKPVLTLPDDWSGEKYVDEYTPWYGGYFYSEVPTVFYLGKNNPEDVWAELSDDGTLTIYGHGETQDWDQNSPLTGIGNIITKIAFADDAEITHLGNRIFYGCRNFESITIPNSVTTIGKYAFINCYNLEEVTLSSNMTTIEEGLFWNCMKLNHVVIPNGITTINKYAFEGCSFTDITLPNSLTTIGEVAFWSCDNLKSITIPENVSSIGEVFLNYCEDVQSVTFEGTPDYIHGSAFGRYNHPSHPIDLYLPFDWSGNEWVSNKTPWYGGYFNLNRVFHIGKEHPEDVWAVFYVSDSTFTIYGEGEMMDFDEDEPPYHDFIEDNVKHVVFDETANVTNIGNEAFVHCYSLESVTIPNSVTTIGNYAFQKCYNLKDITIPSSVTTIGNNILEESHLSKVTFEGTPTTISENAFVDMETTPILVLPNNWSGEPYVDKDTEWYGGYFYSELPTFYIGKEHPEDVWAVFNEEDSTFTIYGEGEMMDFDEDYPPYYYFIYDKVKQIVFDETANVTNIGTWAFGELSVESVTIPNSVTSIGSGAFSDCESLESITIPNSVTTIGEQAFESCDILTNITIPNSVTTIGSGAFAFCESLESITIPSSVTTIGDHILYECYDLQSVTFEGTPESIHENAFTYINYSDPIDLYLPEVWGGEPYISPTRPWYGGFFNMKQAPTKFYLGKEHPEDVVATLAADGTLTITGSGEMQDYVDDSDIVFSPIFIVHNKIQQVVFDEAATVKSIGGGVFAECDGIENIIISSSVETIGDYAFALCESLESITIPSSVTTIGDHILYKCSDLQSVTFEGTPESIDENAFENLNDDTNPIDLNLPEVWGGKLYESPEIPWYGGYFNLKQTPTKFFIGKEHPEDVVATLAADGTLTITGSGDMIDANLEDGPASHPFFTVFNKIKQVVFDENSNVTAIGDGMFEICENLESITIPNSVISIGEAAFEGCESLTNVILPETLTKISDYTFDDCYSLKSITIPSGVTTIGDYAFDDCDSLESITIPSGVTTIGEWAFNDCFSLTNVILPETLTEISDYTFADCSGLESITIPSGVTTIGEGAFAECSSLESITIPSGVTTIGDNAFDGCYSLESITIPSGVTTIGDNAFNSCGSLESITIPSSVTTIGNNILEDTYLTKVTFEGTPATIAENAFAGMSTTPRLVLPSDWSGEPYVDKDTKWYGGYFDNEPEKVFYIGKENPEDAWAFLSDDGTLTIFGHGETADYYGDSPLSGNYAITNVVFDEDAEILTLGNYLFAGCSNLKSITIPNTVTTIGSDAFSESNKLKNIVIPNSVTFIGESAFYLCEDLTNVTLPETITEIPDNAFTLCKSLESITIPSGVTTIGESAFNGCNNLTNLTIPSSVTTIGELIVAPGSNLQSVTFEGTPKNIDSDAFVLGGYYGEQTEPVLLFLPNNWYGEEYIDNETPWYGGLFNLMRIVAYNTNGGSEIANDTIINDSKLVAPTAPTKAMSQFEGWYKDEALASAWNFNNDVVTKNITLYAKWHLHNPVEDELLATCETDGYKKHYVCECGKAFTTDDCTTEITDLAAWKAGDGLVPALNHDYELSEWNWADDNSAASATFVCKNDETHVETVDATITTDTVKATCTEKGLITYNAVATFQGEEYKDEATTELPVLNHDYAFSKWNWADDKSEASATFVCKNDETHVETVNATITTDTVEATCTEKGLITYNAVATFNGEEYKDVATTEIPALNHDYAFSKWNWADDKSEASVTFVCKNDETHVETVNATITTDTVKATCTEKGLITYNAVATFNGEEYKDVATVEIPALNHDYALSKWNWADDKSEASATFACKNDETHVETVTATVTIDTVKATVDKNGKITYTATAEFDGETYTDTKEDIIPALGHEFVFGEWLWSDDKKACSAVFKCINEENHTETVDAKVTADTLKATCLADGLITSYAVATFNGEDYKDTVKTTLPALNHDYALGKWTWKDDNSEASVSFVCKNDNSHVENVDAVITTDTVEATCTEKGLITYNAVATFNGEEYKDVATTEIPALNHDYALDKWTWKDDNSEASVSFVCKNDETHVENVDAVITTDTVKATCTEKGLITYNAVATFNGEEYKDVATTEIPALNHDYALGKWTWNDDNSEASVSFVCKNDNSHVENVDAVITTDTVKATCTEKGLITYNAVATFNGEEYKDVATTEIPALNHDYAFSKWNWADDNSEASATFVCKNDESHVETVTATITTNTVEATCTEKGLITYNAVATFNGEEYKDVATVEIPALNHNFALNKWLWSDDKSTAKAVFTCKNDSKHADTVVATITTDTVKATVDKNGKITYTATAEFDGETYTDTKEDIIPAIGHEFVFGKWLWADDKKACAAVFNCINEENHADTVDAKVTADTLKATCLVDGLITSYAVATFNGEDYKDTVKTTLPALNHDYALGKWTWNEDNSEASVSFVCKNDNSHVENVDATITTDTVKATCTEDGLISYFAVATFQSEEYKDTVETILPAINHDFALDKWLWSDDKSTAEVAFICKNDSNHTDTVVATITTDTVKATCTKEGLVSYYAVATFQSEEYKDTATTAIPAINHDFALDKWLWSDDKSTAEVAFICKNDSNHTDTVVATITTDTVKATCTEEGKISYFAVATFQSEEYKDTVETILPAINHDFALDKWLWSNDKSTAEVAFICKNDSNHADTVVATITTDTVKATCTEEGLVSYYAVATFQSEEYKDTATATIPAINHDYALGEWLWSDDKSTAEVAFICKNDSNHTDTVVATITTDTVKATCTEEGLVSYYAVATFQSEEYKDTATATIPAINHDFALDKWLWSDDKSTAEVVFTCRNDNRHADTVNAVVTSDTTAATADKNGKIVYTATAEFDGETYTDTKEDIIPAIGHEFVFGKWLWADDKKACAAVFNCINEENHADTVDAKVTADTLKATCLADGLITSYAVATFSGKDYKDTVKTVLPALNHDYALGKWNWKDDNSEASVSFVCKNDNSHVENVDATITNDTVKATCTEDGKISYFAVATFQSEEYKDTVETILPAINHDFALDKWLWSDDKSTAEVAFICKNDSNHTDTVVATITTDTVKATCTKEGLVSYYAVATFQSEEYKDTATTAIPAINHDYVLGKWTWKDDNSEASVSFICQNDETHIENVDAVITTDTVKVTCTTDGKISYFAVATFNGKDYKDTVVTTIPALNHDYALGKWTWNEDNSEASVSFICKNDETHVENIDAVITTDTIAATTDKNGKITYTATAEFDGETYTDTKEDIIPAIGHEFVFGKWLWADDKASCAAVFNCINEENHADTIDAKVTADTLKATCLADGLITSYAVATFNGKDYKDTVTTVLPALNHDYALGEWTWSDDKSEASVTFVCKNDNSHVETVDATITTDTVKATCTEDGKISYFAVATFQSEEYKDTVETILPAINHDFALDKWMWSDDKSQCAAIFVCANDKQHADTVSAVVTSDTTAATLTENGKIVFVADVTYEERNYSDTVEVVLYPSLAYADIIGLIQGTYCLTTYSGDEANRPAKDLYFKFYGTDTITQGHFNNIEYTNLNVSDLTNIVVSDTKVTFDYKSNTTFSFALDAETKTSTEVTIKNNELGQVCVLEKTPVEEIDVADIWNIIEGSYINEAGKVQNFIMEPDSETGKETPCFMWVDQFDGAEGFENVDGYFPLAGDEHVRIEKTGNYYDFMVSGDKYFTLTIEDNVVTGFMTYGYDDEDVFKGNYKKLAYSDILEEIEGTYYLTAINGEPKTDKVQIEFEDEDFIIIRNGKTEQKTLVENISRIMYTSDSIAILFKDNSMFAFNVDNETVAKVTLTSGDNVLEFMPVNTDPEAVDELTDNIKVFVRNSEIVVSGLSHDDVVTIYTVNGKLLYKQEQTVETASYKIYVGGIYFVKVGNKTYTVLY